MIEENDLKDFGRKYSNSLLLFIGEGNFSFSASLATTSEKFASLLNCDLIATDFVPELKNELERESDITPEEQREAHRRKSSYDLALIKENLATLKSLKHTVLFDVDATKLHEHDEVLSLCAIKTGLLSTIYVIFNFPHAKSKKMKIDLNRDLLREFFVSCEKVYHLLNDHQEVKVGVIPIVSLCAGQCGIPEVDSVSRGWGNSWQINDMAAHGNFVCTSICNFNDWDMSKMINAKCDSVTTTVCNGDNDNNEKIAKYQSSYYRLQSGVSFTTKEGLTLSYELRPHVDPFNTTRLKSILRFTNNEDCEEEIVSTFIQVFGEISGEKVVSRCKQLKTINDNEKRPYFHQVSLKNPKVFSCILNYLAGSQNKEVKVEVEEDIPNQDGRKQVYVQIQSPEKAQVESVLVGTMPNNEVEAVCVLYLDQLLELKYNCDYRALISGSFGKVSESESLYPRTHEFHISFWLNAKFTMDLFIELLLDVYGLMLKTVQFVEEYVDNAGRKSVCWRIQVQSLNLPLSRLTAHQIYLKLREELANRLEVVVR